MKKIITTFIFSATVFSVFAQHEHHRMQPDTIPAKKDSSGMKMPVKEMEHKGHEMPSHAYSRNLSMNRNASGTSWNPDASPMYMWTRSAGRTDWMFHGNIFLRYTAQDIFSSGSRGKNEFSTPNWFMAMMNRKVGDRGLLNITSMISLDRLTDGGNGYPLLFQSGETYQGEKLVDRQHPHDLFSALSIGYTQMINKDMDIFGYLGYPGEPALGAPAFMHRVSSMNNPDAPLGHHWQDATHITFGTGTLGFRYRNLKAEGSIFTGREPDENRFDFDKARFDSYSYRVSWNPTANWALQFSQGFIKSPESLEPDEDLTRTSASVLYTKPTRGDGHISAAAIWGLNDKGDNHKEHAVLLEGNWQTRKNAIYTRYEFVEKSIEELNLTADYPHRNYPVHALTLGYNRKLAGFRGIDLAAGTQFTVYGVDRDLRKLYGTNPVGFQVYLQLRPFMHKH